MIHMVMSYEYVSWMSFFQCLQNFRGFCRSVHQNTVTRSGTCKYVAVSIVGSQFEPIDLNELILRYTSHFIPSGGWSIGLFSTCRTNFVYRYHIRDKGFKSVAKCRGKYWTPAMVSRALSHYASSLLH